MKRLLDTIARLRPARVATLVSMCFAASAHAPHTLAAGPEESAAHPKLVLAAYMDEAEGDTLLAGHYGHVIAVLGSHGLRFKREQLAASTNLCVAYIMTHRWSEAHPACDEALEFAKLELPEWAHLPSEEHALRVAAAYSNRAVLECLEDRSASATDDLAKARALAPGSEFIAQNLARMRAPLAAARTRPPGRNAPGAAMAAHG